MSRLTDMFVELNVECIEFRKGLNNFQSNRLVTENHCSVSKWQIRITAWDVTVLLPDTCVNCSVHTRLFEMIVGVLTTCHLFFQMQPHLISFYGVTSRIRFMFLLFPQVSRNWRYESEPPLKPSPLTCNRQFGTNSIIVLMFVESQRVHIQSTCKVCNKNLECCSIK